MYIFTWMYFKINANYVKLYFIIFFGYCYSDGNKRKYNGHCAIWLTLYHFFHLNLMFPFEDALLIPYRSL